MLRLSPVIFASSLELRAEIQKEEVPYRAIIAYFFAGSILALSQEAHASGDSAAGDKYMALADKSASFAESLHPSI